MSLGQARMGLCQKARKGLSKTWSRQGKSQKIKNERRGNEKDLSGEKQKCKVDKGKSLSGRCKNAKPTDKETIRESRILKA